MAEIKTIRDLYFEHSYDENLNDMIRLWHYTNANGLVGIVRDNPNEHGKLHFWFTRSDCLNDTSEGIFVIQEYQKICSVLFEQQKIDEHFYNSIKDIEIPSDTIIGFPIKPSDELQVDGMVTCVPCEAFICSFSLKADSLDMWRYYSKGESGYGINLLSYAFHRYFEYEFSPFEEDAKFSAMKAYKVIYSEKEQTDILNKLILDSYSVYLHTEDNKIKEDIVKHIRYILKQLEFQFKHECFQSEEEYRFVYYRPKEKPERLENEILDVKYRTQNGVLVPYIDIEISEHYANIMKVLISPYVNHANADSVTKEYLSKCGFSCEVKMSQLPVRK